MPSRRAVLRLASSLTLLAALPAAGAGPLKVVASFSIIADLVKEVGGPHVEIATLVGPDGDAHVYEPASGDAKALAAAAILFENGLGFEPWLPRLVAASGFKGERVTVSEGIVPRDFAEGGDAHKDPHAWQDLANGIRYVETIAKALAAADPANEAAYQQNAAAYTARLKALDAGTKADFARIPAARRKIVTSHDAFGYFGAAYGIAFIAASGISTEAEASAADVARIIDQIRRERITAVFVENIANTKLTDQIARETGATIGGALFSDALSDAAGGAPTYIAMFEWNVRELMKAMCP